MEEVKLYCHAMNPLAKLGEIGLAELDRCPIAFWDGHREVLERLRAAMDSRGCVLNHVATLPQLSGIANLICNDAAVGMLNGDFVDHIGIIHGCRLKQGALVRVPERRSHPALSGMEKILGRYENMRKIHRVCPEAVQAAKMAHRLSRHNLSLWAIIYRYLWCVRRNATINPTYVRAHLCKETKCEAVINTQRSELSH